MPKANTWSEILFNIDTLVKSMRGTPYQLAGIVFEENSDQVTFFGVDDFKECFQASMSKYRKKPK